MLNRLGIAGVGMVLLLSAGCASSAPNADVYAVVLGVAQDGGHPHLGCARKCCTSARRNPKLAHHVASLALVDRKAGKRFIIDATPDFVRQVAMLEKVTEEYRSNRANPVDGILLTHGHIGHYTGLMFLGRESMAAADVPVYGTARMGAFLRSNGPWDLLIDANHIELVELRQGDEVSLTPSLAVTALPVPHREEYTDTVAFLVEGPEKSLLWLPDIDRWEVWDHKLEDVVGGVDYAFLDATFYDGSELPGRDRSQIPHPLVVDTMERLSAAGLNDGRVRFMHLNHTNPLLTDGGVQADVKSRGFGLAREGEVFDLSDGTARR